MAQLLRETPKANYPIQLLKGALLAMSEKTNGVSEAHLIVARVAKETEDGLLLATRDLLSAWLCRNCPLKTSSRRCELW